MASTALSIYNSTIVGNNAAVGCGAGAIFAVGTVTLANTIVANNTSGGGCRLNCNGTVVSGPDSISDNGDCGATITQKTFAQINLGALTGSPAYFPLNPGSAAIDAGSNAICAAAPVNNTSQNGIVRPTDGNGDGIATCDVGSFEAAAVVVAPPPPPPTPAPVMSGWMMLLLAVMLYGAGLVRLRLKRAGKSPTR